LSYSRTQVNTKRLTSNHKKPRTARPKPPNAAAATTGTAVAGARPEELPVEEAVLEPEAAEPLPDGDEVVVAVMVPEPTVARVEAAADRLCSTVEARADSLEMAAATLDLIAPGSILSAIAFCHRCRIFTYRLR
jgi:hypothetical protein